MPWQELSPVDLRLQFIAYWQVGCWTMTELCGDYRVSRKTGYKWVARYETCGPRGLADQSRRPQHSPQAMAAPIAEVLVALRTRHPRWGAKKLLGVARRKDPTTAWPSRSTVCDLLRARGLVKPRRRRPRCEATPSGILMPGDAPNALWTADFKGEFRTGDGRYCQPLTVRDAFSRYVLRCDALADRTYAPTRRRFERAFADYGLPQRIRSDNGAPFASLGLGGLSRLSVWWIRLGIVPERIAPGHPEQNGSHEQFHSVLKAETARPPARHRHAQQRRFARFCAEYNDERPHEALEDQPPASQYAPSRRPWSPRVPAVEYPGHLEVRRVTGNGGVSWHGGYVFVATPLIGEDIGFEEVADGIWTVRLATVVLGRLDERTRRISGVAPFTVGRSAASPPRARQ